MQARFHAIEAAYVHRIDGERPVDEVHGEVLALVIAAASEAGVPGIG